MKTIIPDVARLVTRFLSLAVLMHFAAMLSPSGFAAALSSVVEGSAGTSPPSRPSRCIVLICAKKREVVRFDKFRAVFFTVDKFVTSCEAAFHDILSPPLQG